MRFENDREREEFVRRIRDGRPILKWVQDNKSWIRADYYPLSFYIYDRLRGRYSKDYYIRPKIILYEGERFARNNQNRIILNRHINEEDIPEWKRRSDILLFNILSGKIHLKQGQYKDMDEYWEDLEDIYDELQ